MKIALCQINTSVGAFNSNKDKILNYYFKAIKIYNAILKSNELKNLTTPDSPAEDKSKVLETLPQLPDTRDEILAIADTLVSLVSIKCRRDWLPLTWEASIAWCSAS